jgi:hypothetical protein
MPWSDEAGNMRYLCVSLPHIYIFSAILLRNAKRKGQGEGKSKKRSQVNKVEAVTIENKDEYMSDYCR